jgi:type I restriction enzyme S subunit
VLRPKTDNVLIEYVHFILRDKRVLESAKNSFGGSAGQQRVSSGYLKSIQIPLPPKEIQQQIVDLYNHAVEEKQAKEQEAKELLEKAKREVERMIR